jgi:hypothetical protein
MADISLDDLICDDDSESTSLWSIESNQIIKGQKDERVTIKYNKQQLSIIVDARVSFKAQISTLATKGYKIYDNQKIAAKEITKNFDNKKILVQLVLGKTQSGKTGLILSTIEQFIENNNIPLENIYCITGLSSVEWLNQTIERMPREISDRIYHRDGLMKGFVSDVKDKKNVLIIIDEVHTACKKDQTLYNAFNKIGLLDKKYLLQNDIKIIDVSATPNGILWDVEAWKEHHKIIITQPGKGYTGAIDLLNAGKIKEFKDLLGSKVTEKIKIKKKSIHENPDEETEEMKTIVSKKKNIPLENLKELKKDIDSFSTPRYHIIRTVVGKFQDRTKENIVKVFGSRSLVYSILAYDEKNALTKEGNKIDLNNILRKKPVKHIIILIKDMFRCAKSLNKKYLGVLYERYTKSVSNDVIIQGLVGRLTGYDYNGDAICYTHIDSIKLYEDMWNNKFKDIKKWKASNMSINGNRKTLKTNFQSIKVMSGFDYVQEEPVKNTNYKYKIFGSLVSLNKFYINNIDKKGKEFKSKDATKLGVKKIDDSSSPYNKCFAYKTMGEYKPRTVEESLKILNRDFNSSKHNFKFRYLVAYRDIEDPCTIQHVLGWRPAGTTKVSSIEESESTIDE